MGTDTKGKQEVETALIAKGTVFTDEVAQSISIGEAQHAIADGLITPDDITELGRYKWHPRRAQQQTRKSPFSMAQVSDYRIWPWRPKLSIWRKNAVSRLRLIFSLRQGLGIATKRS